MIIGSHNSWSYLPVKHWWARPLAFTARCQNVSIAKQYMNYKVRCFDLRVKWVKWRLQVAHGPVVYDFSEEQLMDDLKFFDFLGDCYVRVVHETRTEKEYYKSKPFFESFCYRIASDFPHIRFWCGKNLYNWHEDYYFSYFPTCEEKYASVCAPRIVDDWWPWFFARHHNKEIFKEGSKSDILLVDFVNIR